MRGYHASVHASIYVDPTREAILHTLPCSDAAKIDPSRSPDCTVLQLTAKALVTSSPAEWGSWQDATATKCLMANIEEFAQSVRHLGTYPKNVALQALLFLL